MHVYDSVLDAVGHSPLIRLRRVGRGVRPTLLGKAEILEPGGSIKDRIGITMIEAAERAGRLKPGGTIVEPTAGNTGTGLAQAAAVKGYKCIFVMPDKVSEEKIALLKAYGAEVVLTPTAVAHESPESYYSVADRLTARDSRRLPAQPVRQQGQPRGALPDHRTRDLGADRGQGRRLRGRPGHRRHHQRRGPLPQGAEPRRPYRRRRSRRLDLLRRHAQALQGRGHRPELHPRDGRPRRDRPLGPRERPRRLPHRAAPGPRGGPAGRRLGRHGRLWRAAGGAGAGREQDHRRRCWPIPAATTSARSTPTTGCARTASWSASRPAASPTP